jgi:hypothetical protein
MRFAALRLWRSVDAAIGVIATGAWRHMTYHPEQPRGLHVKINDCRAVVWEYRPSRRVAEGDVHGEHVFLCRGLAR